MPKKQIPQRSLAVILAGGKGTRMSSQGRNKTTLKMAGRPLLAYGLDLMTATTEETMVVKGAYGESVARVVRDYQKAHPEVKISVATQRHRLGTGHAALVADRALKKRGLSEQPKQVVIGYGDHLMFYHPETIEKLLAMQSKDRAAVVLVSAKVPNPTGMGRVIKDDNGHMLRVVEEKVATDEEKKIKEINTGLYCFEADFIRQYLPKIKKNLVSKEYYLTDLPEFALKNGRKVLVLEVSYQEVGIGVNTPEEMEASSTLFTSRLR